VKYLVFFEWRWENAERLTELWKQIMDETEKGSDKWPERDQILFLSHTLESDTYKKSRDMQGFWIVETDNEQHLVNYRMQFSPYADINFIPLTESRRYSEQMGRKIS